VTMAEIIAYQAEWKAWGTTRAGRAFQRFESAVGKAWVTDCREGASMAAMERDWAAHDLARQELIAAIKELQSNAPVTGM
jgi:hypothetical protein